MITLENKRKLIFCPATPIHLITTNYTEDEKILWQKLISSQGVVFHTAKGLPFVYTIKGNEIIFSRKEKSITRATVNKAYQRLKHDNRVQTARCVRSKLPAAGAADSSIGYVGRHRNLVEEDSVGIDSISTLYFKQ